MSRLNLIIIHRGPDYERDFAEIAAKIMAREDGIRVHCVASNGQAELPAEIWQHPTLTVAFLAKFKLKVRRGPVLANRMIGKLAQQDIFRRHGIPTPPSLPFSFGMKLDPILFGEFVVLKPLNLRLTSHGDGVMLFRRRRLEALRREELPADHPLRSMASSFQVQRFVHTGPDVHWNRVSSLFSRPLWSVHSRTREPKVDLAAPDDVIERTPITNVNSGLRFHRFSDDPDVLALAAAVHDALPDFPLLGIDILREERTGRLSVLEANPGGNTWHFSSDGGDELRNAIARDANIDIDRHPAARSMMINQFGAFDVAAEVLARMTAELAA